MAERQLCYPATDAATKARILVEVRAIFGEPWGDDHTEILYCALLVLDRLGLLVTVGHSDGAEGA
jgi:hypothetical protein